jgi:hypothetical protein
VAFRRHPARPARRRVVVRHAAAAACVAAAVIAAGHAAAAKLRAMPSLVIVSGSPQNEHAYAASGTNQYVTDFSPLVVKIVGTSSPYDRVEFTCPQPHCTIRVFDADDDPGKWPDPDNKGVYDEVIKGGTSKVRISLQTDGPGNYTVVAQTIDGDRKGPPSAPFILISN